MQVVDFARSFVVWRIDGHVKPPATTTHPQPLSLNNARVQVESVCRITDRRDGEEYEFALGASCKTERVGVERDIWLDPCGDYVPIFSKDRFLSLKAYDRANKGIMLDPPELGPQPERQTGVVQEAFVSGGYDLRYVEGEALLGAGEIVQATLDGSPLVARIELTEGPYDAVIDHPVKTMNANERDDVYQTDTGPLLLPDLTRSPADLIEGMELAFAAFNSPDWVEFIVRVPTPIEDGVKVHHYSRSDRWESRNSIVAVGG